MTERDGRAGAALVALGFASSFWACVSEEPSVLPMAPEARAMVLIRVDGERREVFAFDIEDPAEFALRLDPETPGALYLSLHAASLEALGLRPGELTVAEPGELAHPLPPPLEAHEGRRKDGALEWAATPEARGEVRRTWLRGEPVRTQACPEITVVAQRLPLEGDPDRGKRWLSVAEHLGSGRVLLGTEYGEWMTATTATITLEPSLSSSVAHASSFQDEDGRIWLAQCESEGLFSMDTRLNHDRLMGRRCGSWTSGFEQVVRMDGAPHGLSREIVTMTRGGKVALWDEERQPTQLYDLGRQVLLQFAAWVAPGRAVVTLADHELIFVEPNERGRSVRPDWRQRDTPPKLYRARRFPDGLAVAGEDGERKGLVMFQEPSTESWWILGQTGVVGALYQIVPTADGFAYAGQGRQLGWWTRETGFCNAPHLGPTGSEGRPAWELGSHSFYIIVPVSEDEMFIGGFVSLSETANTVWWVRRHR